MSDDKSKLDATSAATSHAELLPKTSGPSLGRTSPQISESGASTPARQEGQEEHEDDKEDEDKEDEDEDDEDDEDEDDEDDEDEDEDDEDDEDEDDEDDEDEDKDDEDDTKQQAPASSRDWLPDWGPWAVLIALLLFGVLGGFGVFSSR